jgi:RNA polymerase sigma-70 factor, ECF subfamily
MPVEEEVLHRDLSRAVRRICPPDLADRADDLAQAAVMRILEIRRRREGESEFSPLYLKKAAYSALIDEIRRLRRRGEVAFDGEPAGAEPAESAPDPERRAAGRELGRHIRDCLTRLVRPRALAVTLYLQGHTGPEVAGLLGWSAKKVENLIYRGLADLRQCLTARGVRRGGPS